MRFFVKREGSALARARYLRGGHNEDLLRGLLDEQRGFCAYTERYVVDDDTCAVEHFDPRLKDTPSDGYLNYYGVLQRANQRKRRRERDHEGASFFATRFFQRPGGFDERVRYVPGEFVYEPIAPDDSEAAAFLDYLDINGPAREEDRRRHVAKLRGLFRDAGYADAQIVAFFAEHPGELSYLTVLEAELSLSLEAAVPDRGRGASPGERR